MVEIRQIMMPLRVSDWADIFYAMQGTVLGISLGVFCIKLRELKSQV
jgi:VanZ family protein